MTRYFIIKIIIVLSVIAICITGISCQNKITQPLQYTAVYIDSVNGNDGNDGTSEQTPWFSFKNIKKGKLLPGCIIYIKRGSSFNETLLIEDSGSRNHPILVTDYGDKHSKSPSFTNDVFAPQNNMYGNCIRLHGSNIIVENMYCHSTIAELPVNTKGGFITMWELGAIYIGKNASNCIVRNNEIFDCGVGIKSYGENAIIEYNYIHDCNRVLKKWNWGPIGIWLGADYQEVRHNKIINISAVNEHINWGPDSYGGGADGGGIEIDDARYEKTHIHIHHNYSRECQGFIEVTCTDVKQNPKYENFWIHHNVSDDYQTFVALWRGARCKFESNTIIRRRMNSTEWGVFNIVQYNSENIIRNNIIVTEQNIKIFLVGNKNNAKPKSIINNNLYWAASDSLKFGYEEPGENAIIANPMFKNYSIGDKAENFKLNDNSPAIDSGLNLGYTLDMEGNAIPQGSKPDIGAFEYINN